MQSSKSAISYAQPLARWLRGFARICDSLLTDAPRRASVKRQGYRPRLETLEERDCPAGQLSLTAVVLPDHLAQLSGHYDGPAPSGVAVTFSGVYSGVATTDANGDFSVVRSVASFGTIYADGVDQDQEATNTAQAYLAVDAPVLTMSFDHFADHTAVLTGHLSGTDVSGRTITFSVNGTGTAITDEDGNFTYTSPVLGEIEAVTTDPWGQSSNIAQAFVYSGDMTISLDTQVLTDHRVQLSGVVSAGIPGNVAVAIWGPIYGWEWLATTDVDGAYSVIADHFPLGTIYAGGQSVTGSSTNLQTAEITLAPPSLTLSITNLSATTVTLAGTLTDIDAAGRTVTITGAAAGDRQTDANGNFSVTLDSTGLGVINASVTNLWGQTATASVDDTNLAPSFSAGDDPFVDEDAGAQTVYGWATNISRGGALESWQTLTFEVQSNSNAALFSAAPNISADGTLSFTPAANANGLAQIVIVLRDNGGVNLGADSSEPYTFTITVNAVNDAPSFTADNPPAVVEYGDPVSIAGWATFFAGGGADEILQTPTYFVSNVSNPALFDVPPQVAPDGTLTYTLASYINGDSTFEVMVQDNLGGISGILPFAISARRMLAPFIVNTTQDTLCANLGDGTGRDPNGRISLSSAIQEGNRAGVPVTINFALPAGSTIALSPSDSGSSIVIQNSFTINGPGYDQLTIQRAAGWNQISRLFFINNLGGNNNVVIRNLTLAYGAVMGNGGAIYNQANLTLVGVVLSGNQATGWGGAIYNTNLLNLSGCSLYQNQAGLFGGAIANLRDAFIRDATMIYVNTAVNGAGILNGIGAQLTINTGSEIYSNTATDCGGGIFNAGNLIMQDAVLDTNWATNRGGGLFNFFDGTATLNNVSVQRNNANGANGKGGGIYVRAGTVTVTGGTISDNLCGLAGGGSGVCWIPNVTFTSNNVTTNNNNLNVDPDP